MTESTNDPLYPEYTTVLKTAHDWQEYIKRYKQRNGSRLPVAVAVPTKDLLDLINNFKQVSKSNHSRRKHTISVLAKAHLTDRPSRLVPPGHFLWWVTTHAPNAYNALLAEYHDFCKQQSREGYEPVSDEYIPRPIPRYEYDMVCEASQHFSETYEQYCNRIHAQERAEYLYLKNAPDENEIVSAVEQGLDGNATVVYFIVARHYLGNRKCTRTYRPTHLDKNAIAEIGEEAFRKLVSKYDGKETLDL